MTAGREHAIGADHEIAKGDRGAFAEQDLAGIVKLTKVIHGLFAEHFEMFRRIVIGKAHCFIHGGGKHDATSRSAENLPGEAGSLFAHFRPEFGYAATRCLGNIGTVGHQKGGAVRAVLGLDQEIEGGDFRVS